MVRKLRLKLCCGVFLAIAAGCAVEEPFGKSVFEWQVHDMNRPEAVVVTAGKKAGQAPSNAIVLFGGNDLSQWVSAKGGGSAGWKVENGYIEVVPKSGDIISKQAFGDCQVHVEWASPKKVKKTAQHRGNSGVLLMGIYELQILDSYNNRTYADGHAGAIYGQYPPLFNVSRQPGEWQSYDIIFHRPRFDKAGKVRQPARMTVLHNGVLIQDNGELIGPTKLKRKKRVAYKAHADKLPIKLQEHKCPLRYRNIWVIPLPEE
ncbi:MAG: 3-keto-disaccharide hydrolase [Planctomycetota bacterium]|jgi:hypothetical protein